MSPDGGWLVAVLRAGSDASLLSLLGSLLFGVAVAPGGRGVARASAVAALLVLPAWLAAVSADLAGSVTAAAGILSVTQYGHLVAGSWACVLAALVLAGPGWRAMAALAAAVLAVVLQAGHSHAAAMDPGPSVLRVSVTLHLLAAGAWLGGLVPLAWLVARAPLPAVVAGLRRYSVLGLGCVLVLAVTATVQASVLVGGLAGWVGTAYGHVAMVKLLLFAVLVGIAGLNRQVFGPALAGLRPDRARRRLGGSIAAEIAAGLLVVAAAALLGSLEPAMHQ